MPSAEKLGLVFEEPAPKELGYSIWRERIQFLKEFPGQWARFESKTDAAKHQVKKADGDWTLTTRSIDGVCHTFIRYNGPTDA